MQKYLPHSGSRDLPVLYRDDKSEESISERDILYKVLFDMKKDVNELKKVVIDILQNSENSEKTQDSNARLIKQLYQDVSESGTDLDKIELQQRPENGFMEEPIQHSEVLEESLSIEKKEIDLIRRALEKHNGKRKNASEELGISERTLYRKIKEYNIK